MEGRGGGQGVHVALGDVCQALQGRAVEPAVLELVNEPLELADLYIAQSCRAYQPMTLTLHRVVLDWMSDVMDRQMLEILKAH